jgi:hypothetical protein
MGQGNRRWQRHEQFQFFIRIMADKPYILFTAGSYGHLLTRIINHVPPLVAENYHETEYGTKYTNICMDDHHLVDETTIDGPVIKITYEDNDVSLINRNKWTKVRGHLQEQSEKTYPKSPNKQIYTMAIHVCELLGPNHFKKVLNDKTVEFKFSHFHDSLEVWQNEFNRVYDQFKIPKNELLVTQYYNNFQKGQSSIMKKHLANADDIAESFRLGKKYYSLHKRNYNLAMFDNVYGKIGGHNEDSKEKKQKT